MAFLAIIEIGRYLKQWKEQSNWGYAHYMKLDDDTKTWWRENEMFQRWIIATMGIPIWNLIDE